MSDYLPPKVLVEEILARLPVKSLIRFRCVCKLWRSLFSTPDFISTNITHSLSISDHNTTSTPFLLLRHYSNGKERFSLHSDGETFAKIRDLEYPCPTRLQYYFRVVGFCLGLVCLTDDSFGYTDTIILWNPSIRRYLTLPLPGFTPGTDGCFMCVHGFGFDSKRKDCKVVRVSYLGGENGFRVPPKVEIYSLSARSWRVFDGVVPEFGICEYFWSQAHMSGKVHWVAYKRVDPVTRGCFVLSFELGEEVFGEMALPESLVHQFPRNMVVSVVGESLSVLVYDSRAYSKRCTIWVMKEYGVVESWSKQYDIDLDGRLVLMLGLRSNGEMLMGMGKELASYNIESEGVKKLGVRASKDSFCVGRYMESLVLLDEGTDAVKGEGEPALSEEDDGLDDDAVALRAYYMQTVMLNAPEACL